MEKTTFKNVRAFHDIEIMKDKSSQKSGVQPKIKACRLPGHVFFWNILNFYFGYLFIISF